MQHFPGICRGFIPDPVLKLHFVLGPKRTPTQPPWQCARSQCFMSDVASFDTIVFYSYIIDEQVVHIFVLTFNPIELFLKFSCYACDWFDDDQTYSKFMFFSSSFPYDL